MTGDPPGSALTPAAVTFAPDRLALSNSTREMAGVRMGHLGHLGHAAGRVGHGLAGPGSGEMISDRVYLTALTVRTDTAKYRRTARYHRNSSRFHATDVCPCNAGGVW